ncbi:MAG: phosphotransferase, partial [Candidatus Hodarchaeota archaeon]
SILPKEITSVQLVKGGFNNKNIVINNTILIKEFLKRDEPNDPVYLRYLREKEVLSLLVKYEHTPQLLNFFESSPHFFIIREWVMGSPLKIDQVSSFISHLTTALTLIHRFSKPLSGDFDYFDVIRRYLLEYKKLVSPLFDSSPEFSALPPQPLLSQFFDECFQHISENYSETTVCRIHGDLVLSNLILTQKTKSIQFIDWEYSTLADPLIDLAYLISQNSLPLQIQQTIIESYEGHSNVQINRAKLSVYCDLMNLMSGLWYAIHAARLKLMLLSEREHHPPVENFIKLAFKTFQTLKLNVKKL